MSVLDLSLWGVLNEDGSVDSLLFNVLVRAVLPRLIQLPIPRLVHGLHFRTSGPVPLGVIGVIPTHVSSVWTDWLISTEGAVAALSHGSFPVLHVGIMEILR